MSQKIEQRTYESLTAADVRRIILYRDENTGAVGALVSYQMRHDGASETERGQIDVQFTAAEKTQLAGWLNTVLLPRVNDNLGFPP